MRLVPDRPLEHPRRRRIHDLVRNRPGIHPAGIADRLDLHPSTVSYHLDRLDRAGYLETVRAWGRRHLFVTGRYNDDTKRVLAARSHPVKDDLLTLLAENGPATLTEAADRLNRAKSTVKRHVDDLLANNILEDDATTQARRLRLNIPARAHPGSDDASGLASSELE